jgi:hypothetical protein
MFTREEGVFKIALGAIYNSYHTRGAEVGYRRFFQAGTEFFISHRAQMIAICPTQRQPS